MPDADNTLIGAATQRFLKALAHPLEQCHMIFSTWEAGIGFATEPIGKDAIMYGPGFCCRRLIF